MGGLLLVAASLKLKLTPCLAPGQLHPGGLFNVMASTGLSVPREMLPARADGGAWRGDGGCRVSCSLPCPLPQTQEMSPERRDKFLVFSTWCSSSYHGCVGHCSPHWVSAAPPKIHPRGLDDALSLLVPSGAWQGQARPHGCTSKLRVPGRARSASALPAAKAAADASRGSRHLSEQKRLFHPAEHRSLSSRCPAKPCPIPFAILELGVRRAA